MDDELKQVLANDTGALLDHGWHCSEAMLVGLGALLTVMHPQVIKVATGFAGGIGEQKHDVCGALSGGIMVIGLLYGRGEVTGADEECERLSALYRDCFIKEFGYTICQDLRDNWRGKPGQEHCSDLVAKASKILLDVLDSSNFKLN
jgi:C_GCAxxG_C_C family probable redox protein